MRRTMHRILLLVAIAATLPACVNLSDRGHDAAQVFDVAGGLSEGVSLNLRATKAAQVGFGGYRGLYWAGLKNGTLDVWQEERTELGISALYMLELFRADGDVLLDIRSPLYGDPGFREVSWDVTHVTDRGVFDVGLTINALFVGVDIAVKPAELVDFGAGWFGADILQDDLHAPTDEELLQRVAGDDVRVRSNAIRALRHRHHEKFGYKSYTAKDQMPAYQIRAMERWREFLDVNKADEAPQ